MSGLAIRSSHKINQLNEELYSEFLGNVRSFLDEFFAFRHVTVSIGQDRLKGKAEAMAVESFVLSGDDWLTIENNSDAVVAIGFPESTVFGMTNASIEARSTATFRVDASNEMTMVLVVVQKVDPERETPQYITIGPPVDSD